MHTFITGSVNTRLSYSTYKRGNVYYDFLDKTNTVKKLIKCLQLAQDTGNAVRLLEMPLEEILWISQVNNNNGVSLDERIATYTDQEKRKVVDYLRYRKFSYKLPGKNCTNARKVIEAICSIEEQFGYCVTKSIIACWLYDGGYRSLYAWQKRQKCSQEELINISADMFYRTVLGLNYDVCASTELLIYVYVYNKKHFVREILLKGIEIPIWCFNHLFYESCNLNEVTARHMQEFSKVKTSKVRKVLQMISGNDVTPEELLFVFRINEEYIKHYFTLRERLGIDEARIRILELSGLTQISQCIDSLMEKRFSAWYHELKKSIRDIRKQDVINVLTDKEYFSKFLPEVNSRNMIDFLIETKKDGCKTIEEKICAYLNQEDVKRFLNKLALSRDEENELIKSGKIQLCTAYSKNKGISVENLCRIVVADVKGRLPDLKYDQLQEEIGYCLENKELWINKDEITVCNLNVADYDDFIMSMQVGEIVSHTCISYRCGSYCECLLSLFDGNKKIIYVKQDGEYVGRAIMRLTKLTHSRPVKKKDRLTFRTLEEIDAKNDELKSKVDEEYPCIFLEKAYFRKHLSGKTENHVKSLLIKFAKFKAEKLKILCCISSNGYVCDRVQSAYVYISKSKNGRQYLDSLGGDVGPDDGGRYVKADISIY